MQILQNMGPKLKLYLCPFLFSTAISILLCKSKVLLSDCICSFSDRAEIKRSDGTNCRKVVRACVHSFRMCHPLYKLLSKLSKEGSEFLETFLFVSVCGSERPASAEAVVGPVKVSLQKPLSSVPFGIMCLTWQWGSSRCWEDGL